MRYAALLLSASLVACGADAVAATSTKPAATVPASQMAEAQPTILVSEGGMLRPIANGGRVAIPGGWATVGFSPLPLTRSDLELDVSLTDTAGTAVTARVDVTYEMLDMDHGIYTRQAAPRSGAYRMPISIAMPGKWRFTIGIERGGALTKLIVVVPEIG